LLSRILPCFLPYQKVSSVRKPWGRFQKALEIFKGVQNVYTIVAFRYDCLPVLVLGRHHVGDGGRKNQKSFGTDQIGSPG
jgi:hypothetical protein